MQRDGGGRAARSHRAYAGRVGEWQSGVSWFMIRAARSKKDKGINAIRKARAGGMYYS